MGRPYFDLVTPAMWLIMRGINEIKNHQLELAVAATGGVHYRAVRDSTIRSALDQIGGELHAQYVIAYTPTSERTAGFHTIAVTVTRPNTTVRARPGYFVVEPGDLTTPISSDSPPPSKPTKLTLEREPRDNPRLVVPVLNFSGNQMAVQPACAIEWFYA